MAPSTAIAWFRRDLRVRDLPMLADAARAQRMVPLFVLDDRLLRTGRFPSDRRTAFMLGCLRELDASLRERGAGLVVRHGRPEEEVPRLAAEVGASDVHWTADATPWSRRRDGRVAASLEGLGVRAHPSPGAFVVDDPTEVRTRQGRPYTVFGPFARAWREAPRRGLRRAPAELALPPRLARGRLPADPAPVPEAFPPGEAAGRHALERFVRSGLAGYDDARNRPSGGSSRMSPYLRWGCVSPLAVEQRAMRRGGGGADAFRTELAWRDFYAAVLQHFPEVVHQEFQERYRSLEWARPGAQLEAWKAGRTGFPLVDAGMRQLLAEGWMHNRVRMVVGSFLTKDLHLDWRLGEAHFMEHLLDGDVAANNGGWQWIASTGTDPAPYFQRLFNPHTQLQKFDPDGTYVRRWVPELRDVAPGDLTHPERLDVDGYPRPILDHADERRRAVERYRSAR